MLAIANEQFYCVDDRSTTFYDDDDGRGPYCGDCGHYVVNPPRALRAQTNQY